MQTDLISALPGRKKLSLTLEIGNHWCTLGFPPGKGNESVGTHTDRILNYQLLHSPKHDLHVLGGKGLLGVECKEGAVTFSAIRPFTNHH